MIFSTDKEIVLTSQVVIFNANDIVLETLASIGISLDEDTIDVFGSIVKKMRQQQENIRVGK